MSRPSITALEEQYVTDAVRSGWVSSLGAYVTRFETDFAAFCGVDHAVSVSNGTVALHLALRALRIGPGDEVIVPDLSFIATANSVLMAGATPVFCDIEPEFLCLDPKSAESKITSRTKAIMPVHLYGHPANMTAINELAARHSLKVIEDAAEAHGASLDGIRTGALGNCATFSFYGNKNLTTGEGGMITSNDAEFVARCRYLRDHAMNASKRYWHDELGYNYRIINLQAALGCAQLERSGELLSARQTIFDYYNECLGQVPGIRINRTAAYATNTFWMICAEVDGLNEAGRDSLMLELKQRGVDTRPYFYPMSDMPYFKTADTPVAHAIAQRGFNLPTYIGLERDEVAFICEQLQECAASRQANA